MLKIATLALASLLSVSAIPAQTIQPDSLLDHLIGHWVLRGPMAGSQVVHDVTFRWVLNSEYVEMHEESRERTAAGDSIPFIFVDSPTSRFHNTFVYDRRSDSWAWHMDNDSAGVRRPFARVTLTRK